MLIDLIKDDELGSYLINNSNITKVQLDTILCNIYGKNNNKSLKKRILYKDKGIIQPSAFIRIKHQGKSNIKKSITTLLLLSYLNILDYGISEKIMEMIKVVINIKSSNIDNKEKKDAINLINKVLDDIVNKM